MRFLFLDSNIGEEYRNRKGIFSMNVQGVCNADLLFMNVVARWPGSAHDATIFNNSIIKSEYNIFFYYLFNFSSIPI